MLVKGATGINNADSSGACLGDGLQNKMVHRYSRQNTHTPWHGRQEATFDNFSDPSLMTNKPAPLKHEVAPLTRKYMIQVSNPKSGGGHDKTVAQELFLMFLWGKCDCNLPLAKQLCHGSHLANGVPLQQRHLEQQTKEVLGSRSRNEEHG